MAGLVCGSERHVQVGVDDGFGNNHEIPPAIHIFLLSRRNLAAHEARATSRGVGHPTLVEIAS
jgi:hypothetical protein